MAALGVCLWGDVGVLGGGDSAFGVVWGAIAFLALLQNALKSDANEYENFSKTAGPLKGIVALRSRCSPG